jgi:two-component system sensor histidine kinase MprB
VTSIHSDTDADGVAPRPIARAERLEPHDPQDPAATVTNGIAPAGTGPTKAAAPAESRRAPKAAASAPRRTPAAGVRARVRGARPDPLNDNIPVKVRQRHAIPHLIAARVGNLSLRVRVAAFVSMVVGVTVAITSLAAFFTIRVQYYNAFDKSLVERAESLVKTSGGDPTSTVRFPTEAFRAVDIRVAFVYNDQSTFPSPKDAEEDALTFGKQEVAVARGDSTKSIRTISTKRGERFRVVAVPALQPEPDEEAPAAESAQPPKVGPVATDVPGKARAAFVLAQSTKSTERTLRALGTALLIIGVTGVALAAYTGVLVARQGLRPVEKLTEAAEHVAKTGDLRPITVKGDDELARLGGSFNAMLAAVERSHEGQRRLVADAGHELRTPLTSLRTNLDLLAQAEGGAGLSAQDKRELLEDVQAQVEELTGLVSDLVELAREDAEKAEDRVVDMADIVANAVERARRRAPDVRFDVRTRPWSVVGDPRSLERAVLNLLDNAGKWSPAGGLVTVRLSDGTISVADQGPGIAEADLPFVFDRFYRSDESRTMPGSGLGLAIVRQAAERHKGSVTADRAPQGGALMRLRLPHGSSVTHTES